MLHELVLAGVGGRTVAEARRNLSWNEFQDWLEYRAKHGPLNAQPHMEHAAALVAYVVSGTVPRGKGSKGPDFADFLPRREVAPESDAPIDLDLAMAAWR